METKNNIYIADSSFLVALANEKDATHDKAEKIIASLPADLVMVVPSEVFSETINTLWRKVSKKISLKTAEDIIMSRTTSISDTSKQTRQRAIKIFQRQPNSISFTDCLVMAFANAYKTRHILGFDEAFAKNGYLI